MDEWKISPLVSKGNKLHKRFCLLLIIMAFVGGALIEIGDNSTPDECEEGGGTAVSIGVFLFWTSFFWWCRNQWPNFTRFDSYERNEYWRSLSAGFFSHHHADSRPCNFWRSNFLPSSSFSRTKL